MRLSKITNIEPDVRTFRESTDLVLPHTYIGIENEVEGVNRNRLERLPYWSIVEDGSLRNGAEFVLSEPLMGQDIIDALNGLEQYCSGIRVKQSVRTSIHIHIDVRDLSVQQLLNMVGLYLVMEKAIYRYHKKDYDREGNIYCLPFYKANKHIYALGGLSKILSLREGDDDRYVEADIRNSLQPLNKYYGLNLASLFRFGSLEFRHMEGTTSASEILEWINILMSIKKYAVGYDGHPYDLLRGISDEGHLSLMGKIFSPDLVTKLFGYDTASEDMMEGARIFQDVIYSDTLQGSRDGYHSRIDKVNPEYNLSENYKRLKEKRKVKKRPDEREPVLANRLRGAEAGLAAVGAERGLINEILNRNRDQAIDIEEL